MPYRADGRSAQARERRERELEGALDAAKLRVRAGAGGLRQLERRFDEERKRLDAAIADAEDSLRRALHRSMVRGGPAAPKLRDRMRTGGAVAALERAMAGRQREVRSEQTSIEEARVQARALRARRAKLHAKADGALERAKRRVAAAVTDHDEIARELDEARAHAATEAP